MKFSILLAGFLSFELSNSMGIAAGDNIQGLASSYHSLIDTTLPIVQKKDPKTRGNTLAGLTAFRLDKQLVDLLIYQLGAAPGKASKELCDAVIENAKELQWGMLRAWGRYDLRDVACDKAVSAQNKITVVQYFKATLAVLPAIKGALLSDCDGAKSFPAQQLIKRMAATETDFTVFSKAFQDAC